MGIEDEYRQSTRGLGPLFLGAIVLILLVVFMLTCGGSMGEAGAMPSAPVPLLP